MCVQNKYGFMGLSYGYYQNNSASHRANCALPENDCSKKIHFRVNPISLILSIGQRNASRQIINKKRLIIKIQCIASQLCILPSYLVFSTFKKTLGQLVGN